MPEYNAIQCNTIDYFSWKLPKTNHLVQLPNHFRAYQKLRNVVEGIFQMPLKHRQAWGINYFSRKPFPGSDHHLGKEMLPNAQSKPPLV